MSGISMSDLRGFVLDLPPNKGFISLRNGPSYIALVRLKPMDIKVKFFAPDMGKIAEKTFTIARPALYFNYTFANFNRFNIYGIDIFSEQDDLDFKKHPVTHKIARYISSQIYIYDNGFIEDLYKQFIREHELFIEANDLDSVALHSAFSSSTYDLFHKECGNKDHRCEKKESHYQKHYREICSCCDDIKKYGPSHCGMCNGFIMPKGSEDLRPHIQRFVEKKHIFSPCSIAFVLGKTSLCGCRCNCYCCRNLCSCKCDCVTEDLKKYIDTLCESRALGITFSLKKSEIYDNEILKLVFFHNTLLAAIKDLVSPETYEIIESTRVAPLINDHLVIGDHKIPLSKESAI